MRGSSRGVHELITLQCGGDCLVKPSKSWQRHGCIFLSRWSLEAVDSCSTCPCNGLSLAVPSHSSLTCCAGCGQVVRDLCSQLQASLLAEAAVEAAGTAAAAVAPAQPSAAAQPDAPAEPDAAPLSQQVGANPKAGWACIVWQEVNLHCTASLTSVYCRSGPSCCSSRQ